MRVILDTSVLIAAFRSVNGASNALLELALLGGYELAASPSIFLEYEEVLKREGQRSVHGRTLEQIDSFLGILASLIYPVEIHFSWRPQLRDPNDEMVLEAAISAEAYAIVTHNVRDFLPAANGFRIQVLAPKEFLQEVKR